MSSFTFRQNADVAQRRAEQYRVNLQAQMITKEFQMKDLAEKLDATARGKAALEQALVDEKKNRANEKTDLEKALTDAQQAHVNEKKDLEKALTDTQQAHANEKKDLEKALTDAQEAHVNEKATLEQAVTDLQAICSANAQTLQMVNHLQEMLKEAHKRNGALEERLKNANASTSQ